MDGSEPAGVKAYFSSPVGVFPRPENCVFVPVPVQLRFHDAERSGCRLWFTFLVVFLINSTVDLLKSTSTCPSASSSQPVADLEIIEGAIKTVSDMLDRVLTYVRSVLAGETAGDPALGRYLMDTLGASTEDLEKGGFNSSLQVCPLL